jgi:hypothetical protein
VDASTRTLLRRVSAYAKKFSGRYSHRVLAGIGHNVPQEAPEAFAKAIIGVGRYT